MHPLWKTAWRFLKKLKIEIRYDPAIPLLGIYPDKTLIQKDTYTPMFIAALFTIAKTWKQPKCPSTEERISELEDKMVEITAEEQNKEKRMKRIEDNLRDLWDNTKRTNIRNIGVPEEEEKKKGSKKIFEEIIVKNCPNMRKEIVTQVQEAQRVPYRMNSRKNTPRHILIKLTKIKFKEKILKAAKENKK